MLSALPVFMENPVSSVELFPVLEEDLTEFSIKTESAETLKAGKNKIGHPHKRRSINIFNPIAFLMLNFMLLLN